METKSNAILNSNISTRDLLNLDGIFESCTLVSEVSYVFVCDMKYDLTRWSTAAVDFFGMPSDYLTKAFDIWAEKIHPEDRDAYTKNIQSLVEGECRSHDMQYRVKDRHGNYTMISCKGLITCDPDGKPRYFCGALRKHGYAGLIDPMTGLKNQYAFFDDIRAIIDSQMNTNITLIGIGKFTDINEVHGYSFGNKVIQRFGRYLDDVLTHMGTVYRMDGAKFAIISNILDTKQIKDYYELLRQHYRRELEIDGSRIVLELNSGTLNLNTFDVNEETIYSCLNFAYNESKYRHQGDMVLFFDTTSDANRERLEKIYTIRDSITMGCSGFHLLFQPIVDAKTEKLVGAESLLRWGNEKYGTVPPDEFISVLEKDPLFSDLGKWILLESLRQAREIMEICPEFIVNVNLSYAQVEKPDFVDSVLGIIEEVGFPPSHLCLEITERCRLLDLTLLKTIIAKLGAYGIKFALDDFGTGFSAIDIIKKLHFDTIKIDRGFISNIVKDDKERQLVGHFTGIAVTFGAKVCVEGVETEEMVNILQGFDVHCFQGYYYSRPIPARELIETYSDR